MSHIATSRDAILVQFTSAILQGMASRNDPMATVASRNYAAVAAVNLAVKAYAELLEATSDRVSEGASK